MSTDGSFAVSCAVEQTANAPNFVDQLTIAGLAARFRPGAARKHTVHVVELIPGQLLAAILAAHPAQLRQRVECMRAAVAAARTAGSVSRVFFSAVFNLVLPTVVVCALYARRPACRSWPVVAAAALGVGVLGVALWNVVEGVRTSGL